MQTVISNTVVSSNSSELNKKADQVSPDRAKCPACEGSRAVELLRAPDRFHGRQKEYILLRCSTCSLVRLSDPPQPEEMGEHYTDAYDRLISAAGENSPQRWHDRNAVLALHKQSGSLLDMGCSSGAFLQSLRGKDWQLYGIEMSAAAASKARERSGANVFVGDILDAPFSSGSFDVITCFDVFEHLYEPRKIMSKIAAWLKPGGIFYILVPNIEAAERKVFGTYWHGLELPRHLFHYSPQSLGSLAEAAGLRTVSIETRRNQSVGTSLRYVCDDLLSSAGMPRTPFAHRREASLPWRAVRKITRSTVLPVLLAFAPMVGGGESIHAVFQKDPTA